MPKKDAYVIDAILISDLNTLTGKPNRFFRIGRPYATFEEARKRAYELQMKRPLWSFGVTEY